jgi:aryl-alcohol dehydrogenase-like predicted oxidoreductase
MKQFSTFGVGALHMGSLLDKQASKEIILKAIDHGIFFFDTAPLYGAGHSEEILGEILSEVRHEVFICTKVGLRVFARRDKQFGVEVAKLNADTLKHSVENSLKRLKRESIDLLMLHAFDESTPLEETVTALDGLYREGKIKSFGCSNYNPQQLKRLLQHDQREIPFIAAQCHYNLIEQRAGRIFIPLCKKHQVLVVVNRALARGALSGQYALGREYREDSRAAKSPRIQKWLTTKKLILLDTLATVAAECGTSLMTIALKWLLKNHPQVLVLLGVRSKAQLEGCFHALAARIEDSVFEKIEAILSREQDVRHAPPRYFER